MDFYGFYTGKIFDAYKYLGAHVEEKGVTFRTFAPSASRITLIGEFNDWQEWEMNKVSDGNFWECYVPQAKAGADVGDVHHPLGVRLQGDKVAR